LVVEHRESTDFEGVDQRAAIWKMILPKNFELIRHELEDAGFALGPPGFKVFRKQINEAFPDEQVVIVEMRFPEPGIIETELDCKATHRGELMGNPPTGKEVRFTVHTRNRFEGDRMAERWDRMDVAGLLAQLKS